MRKRVRKDFITRILTLKIKDYYRISVVGAIIFLGLFLYLNSFSNPLIWDDYKIVRDNPMTSKISNLPKLFFSNIAGDSTFYRPMQMLTYMIDNFIWSREVSGYHLTNCLIHISVALSLFWLLLLLFQRNLLAAIASILFVVHPIHTEAITYISGRADALVALFLILSFVFYIRLINEGQKRDRVLLFLSFAAALLSKEYGLIFFGILALYHFIFKKQVQWKTVIAPLVGIAVVYGVIRYFVIAPYAVAGVHDSTIVQRLPGVFVAISRYVQLLILPLDLHMGYGQVVFPFSHRRVIIGLVILVGSVFLVMRNRSKQPEVSFAVLWFYICLLPVLNIFPINAYMAEHWLYLPSIGFFILLGQLGSMLIYKKNTRWLTSVPIIYVVMFFSFLTIRQNREWYDPIRFYKRIIYFNPKYFDAYINLAGHYLERDEPDKAAALYRQAMALDPYSEKVLNNYAATLENQGDITEAIKYYSKALSVNPGYAQTHNNLGLLFAQQDNTEEAEHHYQEAIRLKPDFDKAYYNYGLLLYEQGKQEQAVNYFYKAIEFNPLYEEAHNNLGVHLIKQGKTKEAIQHYKKALRINPNYAEAHFNLGYLLEQQGDYEKALDHYHLSLEINPKLEKSCNSIGLLYSKQGKLDQAMISFQKGLRINPKSLDFLNNLGITLSKQGNAIQAIQYFTIALDIEPNSATTHNNLGLVWAKEKNYERAVQHYQKALNINPKYEEALNNLGLALTNTENLADAENYYNQVLAINSKNLIALNGLGIVHGKQGNYDQAVQLFLKVLEIDPKNANAVTNLKRVERLIELKRK